MGIIQEMRDALADSPYSVGPIYTIYLQSKAQTTVIGNYGTVYHVNTRTHWLTVSLRNSYNKTLCKGEFKTAREAAIFIRLQAPAYLP